MESSSNDRSSRIGDLAAVMAVALTVVALHTFTNGRYGYHRDELQTLDDARHLAWGYVPYPPLTPFLQHLSLALFGVSLTGFRVLASLAQGAAIVMTGLMAREMGGRRPAQIIAAMAVSVAPVSLFWGAVVQYSSFDYLWWVVAGYLVARMAKSADPRWWLAIGAAIGLGMMTKYSMMFLVAGIVGGTLLTPVRR